MTVHAQSVIPTWINSWNPAFYTALTSQENWSYVNQGTTIWLPLFTTLVAPLNNYKNFNRQSEISNFFFGTYGYVVMHNLYGTDGSLVPSFDANGIYSMAGFVPTTISRPVNYYNDAVLDPSTLLYSSVNMTAAVTQVTGATGNETSYIDGLAGSGTPAVQGIQMRLLFDDVPTTGSFTKANMKTLFFQTLHWTNVYQNLNVGSLVLP